MPVKVVIRKNTYFDSVSLMSLSTKANRIDGVDQAVVAMGTEMNKGVLRNVGLFTPDVDAAGNGDLMIVIKAGSDERSESALAEVLALLEKRDKPSQGGGEQRYATLASAAEHVAGAWQSPLCLANTRRTKRPRPSSATCTCCSSATT
jgi:FdrA protein